MVEIVKQDFKMNKEMFESVKEQLQKKLGEKVVIEHVGSTAIPNMYGKGIIDILIGAKDVDEFNYIKSVLEKNNYYGSEKSKTEEYQFFASTTDETKSGDIHIHLVIKETQRYEDFIVLREYLLNNENIAKEYSELKRNLIESNIKEREDYKRIKSNYVSNLINNARKKYYNDQV